MMGNGELYQPNFINKQVPDGFGNELYESSFDVMKAFEEQVRRQEMMNIKSIIGYIECERDLHLKPIPPKQCINCYKNGDCNITGKKCVDLYPFQCPYVVKFNHYKQIILESEDK